MFGLIRKIKNYDAVCSERDSLRCKLMQCETSLVKEKRQREQFETSTMFLQMAYEGEELLKDRLDPCDVMVYTTNMDMEVTIAENVDSARAMRIAMFDYLMDALMEGSFVKCQPYEGDNFAIQICNKDGSASYLYRKNRRKHQEGFSSPLS